MEVFGTVVSALTILELARQINGLRVTVKHAKNDWKRYCDGVQAVGCIQNVLETILPKCPGIQDLLVQVEGEQSPVSLVKHINIALSRVVKDADMLLKRNSQLSDSWRNYFSRTLKGIKFALDKEHIADLLESVEKAHHHLHMALTLASLNTSNTWQSIASSLLNEIKADMTKHSQVLERLESSERLRQAPLDLDTQAGSCHDGGLPSSDAPPKNISTPRDGYERERLPVSRSWLNLGRRRPRKKKRQNSLETIPSSERELPRGAEASGHVAQQVKPSDDGDHDADDDSGDDEEPLSQDIANVEIRETPRNIPHEPEYAIVSTNGKLVQVPVDSAMYQSAVGLLGFNNSCAGHPADSTDIRVEEIMESLSESEWNEVKDLSIEELIDFVASAQSTACATDVETTTRKPHSPITIGPHRESHIFISKTVNLDLCVLDTRSTVRTFCTQRVSVTDNTQVFCVFEPCTDQHSPRCRHITVEVENGDVIAAEELPCKVQLTSFYVGDPSGDALDDSSSRRDNSVASFPGSRWRDLARGGCRRHTVFDQNGRAECALPAELFALIQITTDDSDARTKRAPSEAEDDIGDIDHDQHDEQTAHDTGFPTNPDSEDDGSTFNLLRMIVLYDTYEPPREVKWPVLIQFLSLIDKYSRHVGDKPLKQAKFWASLFQPPTTFDKQTVPWLWIMWKLRMGPEFKKLSSTIQQQAWSSISYWQDGPENQYNIKLPELMLNQLDQRRLEVLSRVKGKISSEIEKCHQQFSEAVEYEFIPLGRILAAALAFGYLRLESDRFLKSQNPSQGANAPDFLGLSFAIVKDCIWSMQELNDWKICQISIADRIPIPLAMIYAFIPVFGAGLHMEGIHSPLQTGFKAELSQLISSIEEESWGLDLNQFT